MSLLPLFDIGRAQGGGVKVHREALEVNKRRMLRCTGKKRKNSVIEMVRGV